MTTATRVYSILDEPVVVSSICDEPEGTVVRHVRFMPLHMENLRMFWEKSRNFRTIFTQEINADFKKFLNLFLFQEHDGTIGVRGLFWVIDDFVGVYYMTHIVPEQDAQVHYSFFDRRHKGRIWITQDLLKHAFEEYHFRRLSIELPFYVTGSSRLFVERLGFVKEGRKRKCSKFDEQWFDANLYGMLYEEGMALNGK